MASLAWVLMLVGCSTVSEEEVARKFRAGGAPSAEGAVSTPTVKAPTPETPFGELKYLALALEYDDLYQNFDKYSMETWYETGGDTPLIYFRGEIGFTEAGELLGVELLSAQLTLPDNNAIVFRYNVPEDTPLTFMVGGWSGSASVLSSRLSRAVPAGCRRPAIMSG